MPLQDELIEACKNGSLSQVEAALAKGALVDLPNEQGKHPIYAAVYGMNDKVVTHLIGLLKEDANPISWKDCETHNKKHYEQQIFLLDMEVAPTPNTLVNG